ncbi:chromosome partitioning protein ParA [Mycolicibacterium fortuitum]|uniref:ParA family protein n=1 Tax=Mycolicibacterium fortuitum TaxID=1766 RepID=UPI0007EC2A87|nr:ParA family protein [Mycolicibacterium fortuitum]OBG11806.1 chromosome partitioning protein ParA [Mycolicibacterium fortuitum]
MKIAIVHTKGGVSKSTSTIYLGAAAVARGLRVRVFDGDPQGSATEWAKDARAAGHPLPFPVTYVSAKDLANLNHTDDLVIIDTPPGHAKVIDAAVDVADLIIVPTQPSPADMRRVWPTLQVTAHRPTAVLIARASLNRSLLSAAREELEAEGVAVLNTPILEREHVKQAWGTTPANLNGYNDVLTEILEAFE